LLNGKADYFIYALYSGNFEAKKLKISEKIESLPNYAIVENFYISISKKSKYLTYLPEINKKIQKMVNDGTVDKLIEKYRKIFEGAK